MRGAATDITVSGLSGGVDVGCVTGQVRITGAQGSGILRSMSEANGLVVLGHERCGAVDAAMKSPAVADRLKNMGIEPVGGSRADFNRFVDAERARLGEVVRAAHMTED